MLALWLLLLLLPINREAAALTPTTTTTSVIPKCCRTDEVLVKRTRSNLVLGNYSDVVCEASPSARFFLGREAETGSGLPACELILELLGSKVPRTGCLEVFLDDGGDDFPVVVRCRDTDNTDNLTAPRLGALRKCCPPGWLYDLQGGHCARSEDDVGLGALLRALDLDFVNASSGPPECVNALVDYGLAVGDLSRTGRSITISIPWESGDKITFGIDESIACLDASSTGHVIAARVCREADYCLANPCIRKCCPEERFNSRCLEAPESRGLGNFRLALAEAVAANGSAPSAFDPKSYGLLVGKPLNSCLGYFQGVNEPWIIGSLGEFYVESYFNTTYVNSCVEFVDDPELGIGLAPFFCYENQNSYLDYHGKDSQQTVLGILTLISCCFLLLTFLIYACLPVLQNLHGKTLMCHVSSLFFAYLALSFNALATHSVIDYEEENELGNILCKSVGHIQLFSFFSAFFWLNVMCFDIWWTFRSVQSPASRETGLRREQRRRFLCYCTYAYGLSLLGTLAPTALETLGLLDSKIGRSRCWFEPNISEVILFIGPVACTLLVNSVFFLATARRCSRVQNEIRRMTTKGSPRPESAVRSFHSDRTRLLLNLKLFMVMGVPWLMESTTALLQHYGQAAPTWIWILLFGCDCLNGLQGLWIFLLFVLKTRVYVALRRRLGCIEARPDAGRRRRLAPRLQVPLRTTSTCSTLTSKCFLTSSS